MYKQYFRESSNLNNIIKQLKSEKEYVFSSYDDPNISQIESFLNKKGIDFVTTSQGSNYIISIQGGFYYRKLKN